MKIPVKEYKTLEADIYLARLTGVEETETTFGRAVKLGFEILDGEYSGEKLTGLASIPEYGLTPKSKLRQWTEALMGRKLSGYDEEVDLDSLIGNRCRLDVAITEKDGNTFNRIEKVLPAPRLAPQPRPLTPEEELF